MKYQVQVVEDTQLPQASPWAIVRAGDATYMFIARSKFNSPVALCAILSSAWLAFQEQPVAQYLLLAG